MVFRERDVLKRYLVPVAVLSSVLAVGLTGGLVATHQELHSSNGTKACPGWSARFEVGQACPPDETGIG